MRNEADKPLAAALRAANELNGAMMTAFYVNPQRAATIIARESGLAELVEAVERACLDEENTPLGRVTIDANDWRLIVATARRVREG